MNLAPLITTKYATTHAKIPWFREGEQRGDTSECRQSQGKTIHHHCHHTSPTSAKQKFWCQRLVFRLYPCQESRKFDSSPSSKEANQVILLSVSIRPPWQIWSYPEGTLIIAHFRWAWNEDMQISWTIVSTRKPFVTLILPCAIRQSMNYVIRLKAGGTWVAASQRIASSKYRTNQLAHAVGCSFFHR